MYLLTDPSPSTVRDFRRRAAAYRNSYYRAYRKATLRGFPDKQFDLLVYIQTDAYTPSPPSHEVQGHSLDGRDGSDILVEVDLFLVCIDLLFQRPLYDI